MYNTKMHVPQENHSCRRCENGK